MCVCACAIENQLLYSTDLQIEQPAGILSSPGAFFNHAPSEQRPRTLTPEDKHSATFPISQSCFLSALCRRCKVCVRKVYSVRERYTASDISQPQAAAFFSMPRRNLSSLQCLDG